MQITVEVDDAQADAVLVALGQVKRLFVDRPPPAAPVIAAMRARWEGEHASVLATAAIALARAVDVERG